MTTESSAIPERIVLLTGNLEGPANAVPSAVVRQHGRTLVAADAIPAPRQAPYRSGRDGIHDQRLEVGPLDHAGSRRWEWSARSRHLRSWSAIEALRCRSEDSGRKTATVTEILSEASGGALPPSLRHLFFLSANCRARKPTMRSQRGSGFRGGAAIALSRTVL